MEKLTRHHILFTNRTWSVYEQGAWLRELPELSAQLTRSEHDYLHSIVSSVPLLAIDSLMHVVNSYKRADTPLAGIGNLQSSIELASRHRKAKPVEVSLAHLAIQALDEQKSVLKQINS